MRWGSEQLPPWWERGGTEGWRMRWGPRRSGPIPASLTVTTHTLPCTNTCVVLYISGPLWCRPSAKTHTHWYTHIQLVWTSLLRPTLTSTGVSPNPLVVPSVRQVLPAWLSSLGWGWHWHQSIHIPCPHKERAHHATTASQLTQSPPPASLLVCFQGLSRL